MTLKSEAKYSSGGGRAPRGSSIRRLLLSKSLLTRRDVKRSHVSPPPQKRKREKKKRRMKTPLSLSPLSLSLSLSEEDEDKDTNKRSNKRSLPSRPLFLFFSALRVGRGQKGRRGFSKGRRNEEKGVLFLSFFSSKGLGGLFFVAEKQL